MSQLQKSDVTKDERSEEVGSPTLGEGGSLKSSLRLCCKEADDVRTRRMTHCRADVPIFRAADSSAVPSIRSRGCVATNAEADGEPTLSSECEESKCRRGLEAGPLPPL